ncbi:hypothetical protein AcW1_006517 [Taiwanofungus camphoratus]|nr:hypothetical protein AcW2_005278 [Antrodia cinnamomea]KAI0954719.1 hypothetical protein AcW1_006517 [Antrodia cinnamomea]
MESVAPTPTPSDAQAPFDNMAANSILRTSDWVDFHIHSVILEEASPFFKQLFSIPQPTEPNEKERNDRDFRDGCPVIPVTENSKTINSLLRLCYPIADPVLDDLQDVRAVLQAAKKYEMEEATVLMKSMLKSFAWRHPLRVWAIACCLRLDDGARFAATIMSRKEMTYHHLPQEMHEVSAGAYFRLLKFHRLRGKVADGFSFFDAGLEDNGNREKAIAMDKGPQSLEFFQHPFADIICRSSDGVEFRLHKIILCMASCVIRELITSGVGLSRTDRPIGPPELSVLDLPEDSSTLEILFKLCYPVDSSSVVRDGKVSMMQAVLRAAAKYRMGRVVQLMREQWTRIARKEPLQAYLTAAQLKLDDCAKEAARRMLSRDIDGVYVPELESSSAYDYCRLLDYHRACRAVATSILKPEMSRMAGSQNWSCNDERRCGKSTRARRTMDDYSTKAGQSESTLPPTIMDSLATLEKRGAYIMPVESAICALLDCQDCCTQIVAKLSNYKKLKGDITDAISKVELQLA